MSRLITLGLLGLIAFALVKELPEIRRYLKIESM